MAIQTATSTTTDFNPSTTASTNSTAATTTASSNPNDLGRNSIPFSFLVAFLALFVAFMGIGLFAKRLVYFVRLRLGLPIPEPSTRRKVPRAKKEKPVLWDVYPEKGRTRTEGDGRWRNIKPLSCYFLRDDPQPDTTSPDQPTPLSYTRTTHTQSHTLLPHAFVGTGRMSIAPLPPPPPLPPLFHSPDSTSTTRSTRTHPPPHTRITTPNPLQDLIHTVRQLLHRPTPTPTPTPTTSSSSPGAQAGSHAQEKKSHDGRDADEEREGVRVAVLIAMPSEERRWWWGDGNGIGRGGGYDRASKASSSSTDNYKLKGVDVDVDVEEGGEEGGGGGLERLGEMSVGIADVPLEWVEEGWEEDVVEEDEKT